MEYTKIVSNSEGTDVHFLEKVSGAYARNNKLITNRVQLRSLFSTNKTKYCHELDVLVYLLKWWQWISEYRLRQTEW
jgi:hypothetical protein